MSTVKELKLHLESYHEDDHVAHILWTIGDIENKCKDMGVKLRTDEMNDVLDRMHSHANAEYGISWDSVESEIITKLQEGGEYNVYGT
tara:strand:- start:26 stop:289 length:264 start_codon:yes stop_codon:yes gene_type:complete